MLTEKQLPPLYQAADKSAAEAQASFLRATRLRLLGLLGAALFGLTSWKFGGLTVDWSGVLAASCFGLALVVEAHLLQSKPERTWYEGRAAAESVKTLSWRFSVGGEPFNIGADSDEVIAELFLAKLQSLFAVIRDLELVPPDSSGAQITEAMLQLRVSPLTARKSAYEHGRVEAQQRWYQAKAAWNRARAKTWAAAMLTAEVVGIVFGILKAAGVIDIDLLGLSAVVVAVMTAWLQTKQHATLATAYTVTLLGLASVRSKVAQQPSEAEWATFVRDAEEAISREHTLWRASRGSRSV